MRLKSFKKVLIASLFFILLSFCVSVDAANYGTTYSRIAQNNKFISNANSLNSVAQSSYTDKYLKDLGETSYKGLTSAQQSKIQNLANNTILKGTSSSYTNIEKLEMFDNWIIKNFYYYDTPNKISSLGSNCNNPYYLLVNEYDKNGTIRAKSNGYVAMLIALARSQGIPARVVGGYYNKSVRDNYTEWGSNITKETINHFWVEVFVNNKCIMIDPVADSYKLYNQATDEYKDNYIDEDVYQKQYFNPDSNTLGKTHISFRTYSGSKDAKYVYNNYERKTLTSFLNIKYNKKTNGKRINSLYNSNNSSYWFATNDRTSITNGYGNLVRISFPSNRSLYGNLKLSYFSKLENVYATGNKLTALNIVSSPSLKTVNVTNNNIKTVVVTGSSKLTSLRTRSNPTTYIKYNFGAKKRTAVIKAKKGGTVSVIYTKNSKNNHFIKAVPKNGYTFDGWYKGSKKISSKKTYTSHNSRSFTYYAKFKKKDSKTYIKVSISKQKLWYYKKGVLKYKTGIVTGQRNEHDTVKGVYTLKGKARSVYLVGDDYKVFVNYWMPIYGGVGLHDATWRSEFGGKIYRYYGSHGCINLPYKSAKYIYNHVPVGTKIKIVK